MNNPRHPIETDRCIMENKETRFFIDLFQRAQLNLIPFT